MILNTNSGCPEGEFSSSRLKQKKNAATKACMNMILIGTLKDNMNFDVPTRSCFQFTYFLLFLLDEAPERIFKIYNFLTFSIRTSLWWWNSGQACLSLSVRVTEGCIYRRGKFWGDIWSIGGRNVAISSFVKNLLLFTQTSLQPYRNNQILPR